MDRVEDTDTGQVKDGDLKDVSEEEEDEGSESAEFSDDEDDDDVDEEDGEEGDEDEGDEEDGEEEEGSEEEGEDDGEDWETDDEDTLLEASDSDSEEADKCPICLNRFRDQDVGTPEACDHVFCLECIQEWAKNVNTCPVDRQVFRLILCKHSGEDKIFKRIPVEDRNTQTEEEEEEDTYCEVCGHCDREDRLLLCDGCDQGYHMDCLTPPLTRVPVEEWFCPECADRSGWAEEADDYSEMQQISAENEANIPRRSRRQIPRTLVSERVRSAIEEIRVRRTRSIRRILSSSEEEEEAEDKEKPPSPSASASSTAASQKPATKKKTTTRRKTRRKYKRKTTKRKTRKGKGKSKRKTTKRKTKRRGTKTKTKGVKRKGTRRKKKVKNQLERMKICLQDEINVKAEIEEKNAHLQIKVESLKKSVHNLDLSKKKLEKELSIYKKKARTARPPRPQPVTTPKSRIADSLGLVTPPKGSTIPLQRQRADKVGDTSLSIFGAKDELIHFNDEAASPSAVEAQRPSKYSRMALSSYKPIGRVPTISPSSKSKEKKVIVDTTPASSSTAPIDLLGSIMQSQTKLHLQSKDITIQKDGSLLEKSKEVAKPKPKQKISFSIGKSSPAKKPGSLFKRSPAISNSSSSFQKPAHNVEKEFEDSSKPGMPPSHGSMGFQPSALNEEYDPAHPTDELEEVGARVVETKMVQDDDKYDPFHPTDDLESDEDNRIVPDSDLNKAADSEDLNIEYLENEKSAGVKHDQSLKDVFDINDDSETTKTNKTLDEDFEAVSPEQEGDFDESVENDKGKKKTLDDDDKSTDLEDEIEYTSDSNKVVILINQDNKHEENQQSKNSESNTNLDNANREGIENKNDSTVLSHKEMPKSNCKEIETSSETTIELRKSNEKKKEKTIVPPKPGFHGGLPQVLLPHQLKVVAKPSEKEKTKDTHLINKENETLGLMDIATKKAETFQKISPLQKPLDFLKKSQYRNKLLYGEIDFTEDVTFGESGFPQQFEVNLKRIEDAFKDTKVEEDKKDEVEIVEEVSEEKPISSISLSDSESRDEQEIKEKGDQDAEDMQSKETVNEKIDETKETDIVVDVNKVKSKKQPEIQVEYIKMVKVKKNKEIPIDDAERDKDKKAGKVKKHDKKSNDKEGNEMKSKSKNNKEKSESVSKSEKENKVKKKSKRKVSIENDTEEDEDELNYRKELQEIKEHKERKKSKDSKRRVKDETSEERDHHRSEKGKKLSEDSKKSKHEKRKAREDSHDKKSRDHYKRKMREDSFEKLKSGDDSYERRNSRSDSYDRLKSRDDSYDRRRSRADSFDRKKSREDSYDRRRSRDDSYDRRKSRGDSYDRRKSRADSFDRRRHREDSADKRRIRADSHDRKKAREDSYERRRIREDSVDRRKGRENSYEFMDSPKKNERLRKSIEESKKLFDDYSEFDDDFRERKGKHKLSRDEMRKTDHREKDKEKKKSKDKHKRAQEEKLKLLNVDYESISEDEIATDIDEKHGHVSEIEEGELKEEYWYKENIKPDKRDRERKKNRDENRTMYYEQTEDGEILYSDKSKLIKSEQDIDTRIVIEVTQDTENRRVWEEDEKRKKKHKKDREERKKDRSRDKESKKEKKSRRRRSKSSSADHVRSRSKEKRKRSKSWSHDKSKKKRRNRSRSHSRDKILRSFSRSLSRERSLERSARKKRKNKNRIREHSWERRSNSLDMADIYGDSEKSWSGSPFVKRHESPVRRHDSHESISPEKEDLTPASQTLMGSILKQESGESMVTELNTKRKSALNKAENSEPAKKKSKTDVAKPKSKKKKQDSKVDVSKTKVAKTPVKVPAPPKELKELNRKESPIIIQDDKEEVEIPQKEEEKTSDTDDEPEETEQFSYTDRDEFLLQNKNQQQHTNLIRIVHEPEKPPSPPSPAPPLPVHDLREGPTPPMAVLGEPFVSSPFPPPPPGPPPGMILTSEGPPVHVQVSGPPGQGILGDGAILIRGLPPPGDAVPGGPQLIQSGPNIPVGISVIPPGFAPGIPQPLRPQRPVLVNAFMNQPPPGFPRLSGSPGPVRILHNPATSQIPSPGAQIPSSQVINGPFEGLPHEGLPNVPPPGFPPSEPRHIVQISTDTPPPNLIPVQHELEGHTLGPPPRSLPLPRPPEPHLVQITSNPHDPRLPIPLHLPPPMSEPPPNSVIVSVPPSSVMVSVPPTSAMVSVPSLVTERTSVTPLQDELFSAPSPEFNQEPNGDAKVFIRTETPPNSMAHILLNNSPVPASSATSIPGLGDLETFPTVSAAPIDTTAAIPNTSVNDELPIFSQLEEISKLLNVQAKLKIMSSQDKRKTNIVNENVKGDGVFKVPLPPGQKPGNSGGKGDSVESNEVTDMDMGSPIDEEGNIELPVSPQYENLIDKPEDLENEVLSQKKNKKHAVVEDVITKKTDKQKPVIDDVLSDLTDEKEEEELEDIQDSFENKLDAIGLLKDIEALTRAINAETIKQETNVKNTGEKSEKKSKNKDSKHSKENRHKHRHHHKHKTSEEKQKAKDIRMKALTDAHLEIDSQEMPSSAVDLTNKEKYLKKLHLQERVVEEVKMAIKPHYASKDISKDQYKEILRKAVPKICHSKSGDINPMKIKSLVEAYVSKFTKQKTAKDSETSNDTSPSVKANGERVKVKIKS